MAIEDRADLVQQDKELIMDKFGLDEKDLSLLKEKFGDCDKPKYFGSYEHNEGPWIQTYYRHRFTPLDPNIKSIDIRDIARALSMQCRFGGHTHHHYSVAQHSYYVSFLCDPKDALWGLLHDASEAYLIDIPTPLKRSEYFIKYLDIEKNLMNVICEKFGLDKEEPESVKKADRLMLSTEADQLLSPIREDWELPTDPLPFKIEKLSNENAEKLFLDRFYKLYDRESKQLNLSLK